MSPAFLWSVRRELWENRSIYLAPLAVAVFVMFGFMVSTIGMPSRRQAVLQKMDVAQQEKTIGMPYDVAATILCVIMMIVAFFYCLDALYGERRDRSILFWKSLPVSDTTAVFAKASIPFVVLPLVTLAFVVVLQFVMLLWASVVLLPSGLAHTTWTRFHLIRQSVILLYGLIVLVLWHAPIYGWLLLISAWAKRAAILWAVLPPLVIAMFERMAFGSAYFGNLLRYRFMGYLNDAFAWDKLGLHSLSQITPLKFLSLPGLWAGLGFAAIFLTAAVRLRHKREPI